MQTETDAEPTAAIIAFPQLRNVGAGRRAAVVLLRMKSPRARAARWQRLCTSLASRLAAAGVAPADVALQLEGFFTATQEEARRIRDQQRADDEARLQAEQQASCTGQRDLFGPGAA